MKFVKILMTFLRLIFGSVYVISGFLKFIDPVGTSLIVDEYLQVMHLGFLSWGSLAFGIILSSFEFLIGISVLAGVRIKIGSFLGLIISSFFTVLTLVMAILDSIQECGCFGEAIHLTMWETFIKNIILTICIIPIFIFRNKFRQVAPKSAEWILIAIMGGFTLFIPIYSVINLPFAEFGHYKVGTNLSVKLTELNNGSRFETRFIYEKDGKEEYFDLDNLPDDSWTYVDSETVFEGDEKDLSFDMSINNMAGEPMAENIVNDKNPVFIFAAYYPEKLSDSYWEKIDSAIDSLYSAGASPYLLTTSYENIEESVIEKYPLLSEFLLIGDFKTLISMVRSNGGVIYIKDGIVVKKWSGKFFDSAAAESALAKDAEVITASGCIRQHVFYELSILIIFIIIILFRYICGILYGKTNGYVK